MKNEAKIENKDVIFNLMLCDKQIQDLQDNHKIIKEMRGKQMHFTELVQSLKVAPSGPASLSDGSKRSSLERPTDQPDSAAIKSRAESEEEDSWDAKSLKQQRVVKGKSNVPNHKTRQSLIAIHDCPPAQAAIKLLPVLKNSKSLRLKNFAKGNASQSSSLLPQLRREQLSSSLISSANFRDQ